jgi:hypothetical protein
MNYEVLKYVEEKTNLVNGVIKKVVEKVQKKRLKNFLV